MERVFHGARVLISRVFNSRVLTIMQPDMNPPRTGGTASDGRFKTKRQVTINGTTYEKEFVQRQGETKTKVLDRADAWKAEIKRDAKSKTAEDMTVDAAFTLWLESRQGRRTAKTLKADHYGAGKITSVIGPAKLAAVNPHQVDRLLRPWGNRRTGSVIREVGRKAFRWFQKNGWLQRNAFEDSEPTGYAAPQYEDCMAPGEFDKALATVTHPPARALLLFLRWTGIRPVGGRRLMWSDIREKPDGMQYRKQVKTTASYQWNPVPNIAAEVLRALPKSSLFVFTTTHGRPYSETALGALWKTAQLAAHEGEENFKPIGVYQLRHLRATEIAQVAGDAELARLFGHTKASTTRESYVQMQADLLRKIVETA